MFFEPNRSLKFTLRDDLRIHRRARLAWASFTFGADVVNKQGASSHTPRIARGATMSRHER